VEWGESRVWEVSRANGAKESPSVVGNCRSLVLRLILSYFPTVGRRPITPHQNYNVAREDSDILCPTAIELLINKHWY